VNDRITEADFLLPAGTVTLLLADLEGSVRNWQEDSERMVRFVGRQDELISEAIAAHAGVRPRDQGEGDSFLAAFARATDALACAISIQLAFAKEDWEGANLRLRMGIHTGEVQYRDEGNYVGVAINRAARLRDIGHGGQILISQSTHELVVDGLPESTSIEDRGMHRLRDLARPEHVYQVSHRDLIDEFPPLRSLDAMPNNLPTQLTSFIGRAEETAEVERLLGDARLLTLTGSGGCGKTRLALQVAADLLEKYPDGVWWVDLSAVTDPQTVPNVTAAAMSVMELHGTAVIETLKRFIRKKSVLILLDNCEHLVAGCTELADALLKDCPLLQILATSREPLGVAGEIAWRVPSLTVPDEKNLPTIDALNQYGAVQLFIERASLSRSGFEVTNENAPAVAEICHRLDGIPLAIELAASRVRVFSPQQISEGLGDRFRLLTGGSKTVMPRQQTLQASIDWSYDLLSGSERLLLDRLSIFSGGFTFEAAEQVCAAEEIEKQQVLDLLTQLVDKSLVLVDEFEGAARYRLLETVRQYARDRLGESGDTNSLQVRHRDYYITRLGSAGLPPAIVREYRLDQANFEAALEYSAGKGDAIPLVSIAIGLTGYFCLTGQITVARYWLERALAHRDDLPSILLANGLFALSSTEQSVGNLAAAREPLQESYLLVQEMGDKLAEAWALLQKAFLEGFFSDRKTFSDMMDQCRTLAKEMDNKGLLAGIEHNEGYFELWRGNPADGIPHYDESIRIARDLGLDTKYTLIFKAVALLWRGDIDASRSIFEELIESDEASDLGFTPPTASFPIYFLAYALYFAGDYHESLHLAEKALSIGAKTTVSMWVHSFASFFKGLAELALGDAEAAFESMKEAHSLTERSGTPITRALGLVGLGHVERGRGNLHRARELISEALPIARDATSMCVLAGALPTQYHLLRAAGETETAEQIAFEELAMALESRSKIWSADALELVGASAVDRESHQRAARLFGAAQAIRVEIGYARFPIDREQYNRDLSVLQEALGEEFEDAWTEGTSMGREKALTYAQKGRGMRKRPSSGWAALTPSEIQVVKLVAEGLTNPQIGESLFVSKRTVQGHLSRIFSKLGVASRAELAAEASRRSKLLS
jgi:predicted ATPase/class 3 adenylate cyclase/DNA-binding CsgD family transcriptional regulator